MDSDEVPQVYLGAPSEIPDGVQFPVRALARRSIAIHLAAGEAKTVTLHVPERQLAVLVDQGRQVGYGNGQTHGERGRFVARPACACRDRVKVDCVALERQKQKSTILRHDFLAFFLLNLLI